MSKIKSFSLILGVLIMSFLVGYLVLAWTEPGTAPPGGNVPAPINVGPKKQWKLWNSVDAEKPAIGVYEGSSAPFALSDGQIAASGFRDTGSGCGQAAGSWVVDPSGTSLFCGNVGIGTTGPGSTLTVRRSAAGDALAIRNTGDTANTFVITDAGNLTLIRGIAYSWPTAQGGANTFLQNNGSGTLSWAAAGGAPTGASYVVAVSEAGLTAERILTAGAGISVTDVAGNPGTITVANTSGVLANKGLQVDASKNFGIINCVAGQIVKYNAAGQWVCDTDQTGAGGGGGYWTLNTGVTPNTLYPTDTTLNVGIGNTNTTYKLDITGNSMRLKPASGNAVFTLTPGSSLGEADIVFTYSSGAEFGKLYGWPSMGSFAFKNSDPTGRISFLTTTGEVLSIWGTDGNGNVGIGTGANYPAAKLEVVGNIIAQDPTAANHVVTKGYADANYKDPPGSWTCTIREVGSAIGTGWHEAQASCVGSEKVISGGCYLPYFAGILGDFIVADRPRKDPVTGVQGWECVSYSATVSHQIIADANCCL